MVRVPIPGNGAQSAVHYLRAGGLGPARSRALGDEMNPLAAAMLPDGSLAVGPGRVAQSRLMNELPAFFQAYASSDSAALNRFEVRGVPVTGLGGAVAFDSISALHVPPGGASRHITVTVIWQLSEQLGSAAGNLGMTPKLAMTYGMSVVDLHVGKWYVKEIGATTETVGAR